MIRPVTVATFLLALGSGLYVYQSKHEVQMLDRTIEHAVRSTAAVRDQTHLLAIEYAMLTNQERLRQLSDTYLTLKSIAPPQFTSLADLDSRLPAVVVPAPPQPQIESAPSSIPLAAISQPALAIEDDSSEPAAPNIAHSGVAPATKSEPTDTAEQRLPVRPLPEPPLPAPPVTASPRPAAVAAARPVERAVERAMDRKPASRPAVAEAVRPAAPMVSHAARVAEVRPAEPRQAEPHALPVPRPPLQAMQKVAVAAPPPVLSQPIMPRPNIVAPTVVPVAAPYGRSLLGMARASTSAAPRPAPFGSYNAN